MLKAYACIWSDKNAAEMVKFYKSVFKGTQVGKYAYWGFTEMPFNESISFVVPCKTQREIDTYWKKLTAGGGKPVECGWVIDKFGVRWQIAPADFDRWNTSKNTRKKEAMVAAMWRMKKLDIKKLKAAFDNAGDRPRPSPTRSGRRTKNPR
jgi:predicted 3-demethylubiquinone-9 3-methyltransferase (glyoxalase superfamily)